MDYNALKNEGPMTVVPLELYVKSLPKWLENEYGGTVGGALVEIKISPIGLVNV